MSFIEATLSQLTIPSACDPYTPLRKRWRLDGTTLIVPNALEDKKLRWMIDQGADLVTAYKRTGLSDLLPEQGLQDCIYEVLKWKYLADPANKEWRITGGNVTCIGYWICLVNYVEALREMNIRGRIKIEEGLYAPSPAEAQCIKNQVVANKHLAAAYQACGAIDILPEFGVSQIEQVIRDNPKEHLYLIIKHISRLTAPVPDSQPVTPALIPREVDKPTEKDNTLLYAAGGVALALILSRL